MELFDRCAALFRELQDRIIAALEQADGKARFGTDEWVREGGGGGISRVITNGALLEKGGVNFSSVEGEMSEDFARQIPGSGRSFRATGVSLVLHPRSPMVPTTHANFRYIEKGDKRWFGGGGDLTPYYFFREDAEAFHRPFKEACDKHAPLADYERFKTWCDKYFYLPHRGETRGIGGIFYDNLYDQETAGEGGFAFARDAGAAFLDAYLPIVAARRDLPYGERERTWQLRRRGRYVEFNLLFDRGTTFGLRTGGRTESILMSMPPLVRWDYQVEPDPDSPEAELLRHLKPVDWLGKKSSTRSP